MISLVCSFCFILFCIRGCFLVIFSWTGCLGLSYSPFPQSLGRGDLPVLAVEDVQFRLILNFFTSEVGGIELWGSFCEEPSQSGLDKFTSAHPIFRSRNFICVPDRARKKKTGAQNQSQSARLIEKQLETIIIVLCYLNSAFSFHFCFNSIKNF